MAGTYVTALALNCTVKPAPGPSSTEFIAQQILDVLTGYGGRGDLVRVVDENIKPGVETDMGDGDGWAATPCILPGFYADHRIQHAAN